ncbi:MAG: NAD(P)/FAD-dependent oxidoreductase [Thermoplasmatota archaeon]
MHRVRRGDIIKGARVAVVGAGPAGISAAIQLKKEGVAFELYERKDVGGLLNYAYRVDNLLGHAGKSGPEICKEFRDHLDIMGVQVVKKDISKIERSSIGFTIDGEKFTHLVLATGSVPRRLDLPGALFHLEPEHLQKGGRLLIVGGGDLAFDNALRAAASGMLVTVLIRDRPSANETLLNEARSMGVNEAEGDALEIVPRGESFLFRNRTYDNVAVFIGRTPNRTLIDHLGDLPAEPPFFTTSIKGLYIVGDAALGTLSQTALASGSGIAAAMHIARAVRGR